MKKTILLTPEELREIFSDTDVIESQKKLGKTLEKLNIRLKVVGQFENIGIMSLKKQNDKKWTLGKWKFPSFFCWHGDAILKQGNRWSLGWWSGRDGDSHLILPNIKDRHIEDLILSPVCKSRLTALIAFVLKKILVKIDENVSFYLKRSRLKG